MRNILWLLILACMWAPSFLFIKLGLGGFTPISMACTRLLLAAGVLNAIFVLRGGKYPREIRLYIVCFIMGFLSNALPFSLFNFGEQFSDSGAAAIMNGTTPIFTTILAHVFIHDEKITIRRSMGVLLGFAGIVIMFLPEIRPGAFTSSGVQGLMAFLLASVSYGIATVFARKHLRNTAPLVAPSLQFIGASIVLLPAAFIAEHPLELAPSLQAWGAVAFLSIVGSALAYIVFYRMITRNTATFMSYVTYILPPAGLLLGIIFLNEKPGVESLVGCVFILSGVLVLNMRKKGAPKG